MTVNFSRWNLTENSADFFRCHTIEAVIERMANPPKNLLVSPEEKISNFFSGILTWVVVFLGLIFNFLTLLGFYTPRRLHRIDYYLIVLTFWDILLLLSAFMMYGFPTVIFGYKPVSGAYIYLYPVYYGMSNTALVGTVWAILSLSVDRSVALCMPLFHRKCNISGRKTWVFLCVVCVSTFCYCLPQFFEISIYDCTFLSTPFYHIGLSKLRQNLAYNQFYKIIGNLIFCTVGPFFLLLFSTFWICVFLKRGITRSSIRTSARRAASQRITRGALMLTILGFKFLVSRILPACIDITEAAKGAEYVNSFQHIHLLITISDFLVILNSSTNFFVYFIFGTQFRASFYGLLAKLCWCCPSIFSATLNAENAANIEGTLTNTITQNAVRRDSRSERCIYGKIGMYCTPSTSRSPNPRLFSGHVRVEMEPLSPEFPGPSGEIQPCTSAVKPVLMTLL